MIQSKFNRFHMFSLCMGAILLSTLFSCTGIEVERYYERGALATASPIASEIGAKIFKDGGNAFDAAVAVGFVLAVVHPEAGNIGGGGFALLRDSKSEQIVSLDFRETAPANASETMFLAEDSSVIENLSINGALASGTPGTVAGLYAIWEKYCTMEWSDLVTYAASLADTGFIVDAYLENKLRSYNDELSLYPQTKEQFFPDGNVIREGSKLTQPKLAKALYLIAAEGPDAFYKGAIADSIEATMTEYSGLISKTDLSNYKVIWRDPVRFQFDSLDIYAMAPPSSGGIAIGQILKLIEPFDLSLYQPNSVTYMILFSECSKLAFADRSKHLGDPRFYDVPQKDLLSKRYLEKRSSLIELNQVNQSEGVLPGTFLFDESEETTHFSIADNDGNLVSLTYTLNTSFGSKLMVNGFGFLLNNEMDDFSVKSGVPNNYGLIGGEANKIEPGKRMLSSMSPTIVMYNDRPFLVTGSPGGSKIITSVAQSILNFTRFHLSLSETVAQPRFHHQWLPDELYIERGSFSQAAIDSLTDLGYTVTERDFFADLQMLYIGPGGIISGASDPRNNGTVSGF